MFPKKKTTCINWPYENEDYNMKDFFFVQQLIPKPFITINETFLFLFNRLQKES